MKKILIGVTGSIAAYKIAELVRQLKKTGYEVRVVMTESATKIISPMTLQVLSQNDVRCDLFNHEDEAKIDHISLARWADNIVIAPATANVIAKMAMGVADDLLSTICLATDAPISIAPAMNRLMWEHPATQNNVQVVKQRGVRVIEPTAGEQACGEVGIGRMAEPEYIVQWLHVNSCKNSDILLGKKIVITAGPTIERIDPVRFISNDSSGKMGYALAQRASAMGAEVILVSGKTALPKPQGVTTIEVASAQDMLQSVMNVIERADWFIATAAVSDYRVANPQEQKIKKNGKDGLCLELVQNPDILKTVCELENKPFCIGFAAETEFVIEYAKAKRIRKGADVIFANDVSDNSIGFNSDENAVTVIGDDYLNSIPTTNKSELATELLKIAIKLSAKLPKK